LENIQVTIDDRGIAVLELNRPDVLNVLNAPLLTEMFGALKDLGNNDDVQVLIVTGRGRGFCAGADLGGMAGAGGSAGSLGEQVSEMMLRQFNPVMELLYEFPRPVISAINGIAAGGGAAIALCADIVLASHSAALKVVQVPYLGIVADLGANWLLPRIAGRSRALGACLLGDTFTASRLHEWGLVWECVADDQLMGQAREFAVRLAQVPAEAVVATRKLVDSAPHRTFAEILEGERQYQRQLCDAPFFVESANRFLGK
jgi:2-(1,2-epoxy-1,2-dihydrophenyl)acetyl-CoA isomerase